MPFVLADYISVDDVLGDREDGWSGFIVIFSAFYLLLVLSPAPFFVFKYSLIDKVYHAIAISIMLPILLLGMIEMASCPYITSSGLFFLLIVSVGLLVYELDLCVGRNWKTVFYNIALLLLLAWQAIPMMLSSFALRDSPC